MTENRASYTVKVSEHEEQANFIRRVALEYRDRADFVSTLLFAIPNGAWLGGNSYGMMNKLKKEGFKSGIADLLYLQPRGGYNCLAIEMKAVHRRNEGIRSGNNVGGVTDEENAFLDAVQNNGGIARVCYGADEAFKDIQWYMAMKVGS